MRVLSLRNLEGEDLWWNARSGTRQRASLEDAYFCRN